MYKLAKKMTSFQDVKNPTGANYKIQIYLVKLLLLYTMIIWKQFQRGAAIIANNH